VNSATGQNTTMGTALEMRWSLDRIRLSVVPKLFSEAVWAESKGGGGVENQNDVGQ